MSTPATPAANGLLDLLRWLVPYQRHVVLALWCALLSAAAAVLVPVVVSRVVIDELLMHARRTDVPSYAQSALNTWLASTAHLPPLAAACLLVLFWSVLSAGFGYVFRSQLSQAANAGLCDLRRDVFAHAVRLPPSYYDRTPVGQVLTRLTTDIESLSELALGVGTVIGELVPLAAAASVMLALDTRLTGELTPVLASMIFVIVLFRRATGPLYLRVRDSAARLNVHLHEHLAGVEHVQLSKREARNRNQFRHINETNRQAEAAAIRVETVFNPILDCIPNLTLASILWFGGQHVLQGRTTLGTLVLFLQFSDMLIRPVIAIGDQANALFRASAACARIFQLLNCQEALALPERCARLPERVLGQVEYRALTFRYPASAADVIDRLTLSIQPGQTLAIVGPTGSGKTTLTRLLCRLYDAPLGTVFIDGLDVMSLDPAQVRKRVGVIPQDFHIFHGTIYDNIALGNPAVTRERAQRAAALVHAASFIHALPDGFDTLLEDRGHNLSHGQRQLLAFARVLALDPEILILDEATASVDPETEADIQAGIADAIADRTAIIVAHRLQTIRAADQIAVLERGRLVELGDHATLMRQRGLYRRFYELQLRAATV